MNGFFIMVVELAKELKDKPSVLIVIIILVGSIFLIWNGKLQGSVSFGG